MHDEIHQCVVCVFGKHFCELASVVGFLQRVAAHCNNATLGRAFQNQTCDGPSALFVCLFVFISGTMRFSRYGLGASYLATQNHSAIPEVTLKSSITNFARNPCKLQWSVVVLYVVQLVPLAKSVSSATKRLSLMDNCGPRTSNAEKHVTLDSVR
jgi:hypothetical protein